MKKRILIILFSFMYSQDTLYFVYNAKGDIFSVVGDFFHKSLSPKTYPCKLCDLSYGIFSKKKAWEKFLDSLDVDYEFVYKNKLDRFNQEIKEFPIKKSKGLPIIKSTGLYKGVDHNLYMNEFCKSITEGKEYCESINECKWSWENQ